MGDRPQLAESCITLVAELLPLAILHADLSDATNIVSDPDLIALPAKRTEVGWVANLRVTALGACAMDIDSIDRRAGAKTNIGGMADIVAMGCAAPEPASGVAYLEESLIQCGGIPAVIDDALKFLDVG